MLVVDRTDTLGQVIHAARDIAGADGWPALTMRRLAGELGVTQPVLPRP